MYVINYMFLLNLHGKIYNAIILFALQNNIIASHKNNIILSIYYFIQ